MNQHLLCVLQKRNNISKRQDINDHLIFFAKQALFDTKKKHRFYENLAYLLQNGCQILVQLHFRPSRRFLLMLRRTDDLKGDSGHDLTEGFFFCVKNRLSESEKQFGKIFRGQRGFQAVVDDLK